MTLKPYGEFQPLDDNHEGRFIKNGGQVIGLELVHYVKSDEDGLPVWCKGSPVLLQWEPYGEPRPLFTLLDDGTPGVSLDPHVVCAECGDRGRIRDGKWIALDIVPSATPTASTSEFETERKRYAGDAGPTSEATVDAPEKWTGPSEGFVISEEDEELEREITVGERHLTADTPVSAVFDDPARLFGEDGTKRLIRSMHDALADEDKREESMRASLLNEALGLVTGDRNNAYGPPHQDFQRTAEMATAMYRHKLAPGAEIEAHDIAMIVMLIKLSRLQWTPNKRDNWTDIAGYAACGYEAFFLTHPEAKEL